MPESTITFTEIIETELRGQAAEAFDARLDIGRVGHVGANAMRALEKGTFSIMENARISDAHLLMASAPPAAWQNFLVPLYPKGSELFGEADSAVATVKRPTLNGITFFDQKRKSCVQVYDLQRFMQRFATYTSSVLAHINWANVLVAGGAVLASLTSDIGAVDAFAGNDIDLYLYGLSEEEADAKLLQIREGIDYAVKGFDRVYKTTLSSGVVTFEPRAHGSSLRSIQIVLRMHINPAHILASFDLDQCAVGFSGNQVWLEPRAVRAIKLGVSYITTQLMHGTSIRRLFKYGLRGYGLVLEHGKGDTITKGLAAIFTRAYDEIRKQMDRRREPQAEHIPPHRSVRAKDLVQWAREKADRPFLEGYRPFCLLAALWDHDCAWVPDLRAVMDNPAVLGDAELSAKPMDYEPVTISIETTYDCDVAIKEASELDDEFSLSNVGVRHERIKCGPLPKIWSEIYSVVVYLPIDLAESIAFLAPDTAGEGKLALVPDVPRMHDADGNVFALHTWLREGRGHWQPAVGQERIVHTFLKGAAGATVWAMSRAWYGAPWPELHYGRVLRTVVKRMRTYREHTVNAAQLDMWLVV